MRLLHGFVVTGFLMLLAMPVYGQVRTYPFTLTWTDNSNDETGFIVYQRRADGTYQEVGRPTSNVTTFVISITGNEGASYCFQLSAYNAAGESTKTPDACAAIPVTLPAPATGLTATINASKLVTLSWVDNSDNEQGFKIYENGVEIASVGPNIKTFSKTVTGTTAQSYKYEVAPYNSIGVAAKSNAATVSIPVIVPVPPSGLSVVVGQRTAALQWKDNSNNERGFQVARDGVVVAELKANEVTWFDNSLAPNRWYVWKVRGVFDTGVSSWTPSVMKKTLK